MQPLRDMRILVPVDVSEPDPPSMGVLDVLRPFEIVLLGYFPVPDQAEPAHVRSDFEDEAAARLDALTADRPDTSGVLVFTHDREATIDRVADQHDCDCVLTTGDTAAIERILVPIRGDVNLERIVSVVAGLLSDSDATATFFHAVAADAEPSVGEFLLRGSIDRLTEYGVDEDRVDWRLSENGDRRDDIVAASADYDLVVLGESEPSLRERIIGAVLSSILDDIDVPALVVRDVE